MKKILITDFAHELLKDGLVSKGFDVDYMPDINMEEVFGVIEQYHGLIVNSKIKVDAKLLERGAQLNFVGRLGSGLEVIDLDAASERNVSVINSPEGNRNAVAEHALGMLLCLANNILPSDRDVRSFIWNRELRRGIELEGKTIGLIGYGHTGTSFRKLLRGFDINVIVYDKYIIPSEEFGPIMVADDMEQVQKNSDIISFHLPLTKDTFSMVGKNWLNGCKNGVIILNTSRGKVIQTQALIESLENGKVSGACLDVFENESPSSFNEIEQQIYKKLYAFPQVILTPHIAGWTQESKIKIALTLLEKINKLKLN